MILKVACPYTQAPNIIFSYAKRHNNNKVYQNIVSEQSFL